MLEVHTKLFTWIVVRIHWRTRRLFDIYITRWHFKTNFWRRTQYTSLQYKPTSLKYVNKLNLYIPQMRCINILHAVWYFWLLQQNSKLFVRSRQQLFCPTTLIFLPTAELRMHIVPTRSSSKYNQEVSAETVSAKSRIANIRDRLTWKLDNTVFICLFLAYGQFNLDHLSLKFQHSAVT